MLIRLFVLIMAMLIHSVSSSYATNWVPVNKYPIYISGININGVSKITEPRPNKSGYLQTLAGEAVLIDQDASLFLNVKILKEPFEH